MDTRTSTLVVAASNSLDPTLAPGAYRCDGIADNVEMNAALVAAAAVNGRVELLEGDYNTVLTISVAVNVALVGNGWGSVINFNAGGNAVTIAGDNVKLRDFKIVIVAGAGGAGTRPNGIIADTRINLEIFGIWQIGDKTVADDGASARQNGVYFDTVTESRLLNNRFEGNDRNGICLDYYSDDNTITGNTCTENGYYGIYLYTADDCSVTGNICRGNTNDGIRLFSADRNTLTGNTCQGNNDDGISLGTADRNTVTGNTCHGNVTGSGLELDTAIHNTIVGNTFFENAEDGINIQDDSDYNIIHSNTCYSNLRWGISIGIIADSCVANWVKNNQLRGNTSGAFIDNGINTRLATKVFQFIQGTTFISAADNPWGWEIDADTEYAIALGQLPRELQMVVRIKIWAVGLVDPGPGNNMRAQFTGEAGGTHQAYTTEAIDVVDKNNEELDFSVNDVIHWILTSADDADIGDLTAGDSLQLKVLHEGAGNGDIETDAIFRCVEIEYV